MRARVSARRRALGSRNGPAMCRTRSTASARGMPAAVIYSGRVERPRRTGRGVGGRAERGFGHADHWHTELAGPLARGHLSNTVGWK